MPNLCQNMCEECLTIAKGDFLELLGFLYQSLICLINPQLRNSFIHI